MNKMIRGIRTYAMELVSWRWVSYLEMNWRSTRNTLEFQFSYMLICQMVPITPQQAPSVLSKSGILAELASAKSSTNLNLSRAQPITSFDVSREVKEESMLVIKQYLEKYFDVIRVNMLKKVEKNDSIRDSNVSCDTTQHWHRKLSQLKEALNGLTNWEMQATAVRAPYQRFRLFKDKNIQREELKKQLETEREARRFYETVQRELLDKVKLTDRGSRISPQLLIENSWIVLDYWSQGSHQRGQTAPRRTICS